MNHYTFEDLYVGLKESFTVKITEDMLDGFCKITGDNNPLHNDATYATDHGYKGRVCYGLLTTSLLSTLAGVYLPGERSLIREVNVKMPAPVYIGDDLHIEGEIIGLMHEYKIFDMKVTVRNGEGKKVLRGKMQMSVI